MLDPTDLTVFSVSKDKQPLVKWADLEPGEKRLVDGESRIGLATGKRSGVFVLDQDDLSVSLPGPVPVTYTHRTPHGRHLFFRYPDFRIPTLTNFPLRGWDIRGDGGYVVLEAEGYCVEVDAPVAEAPEWLYRAIAEYEISKMQRPQSARYLVDLSTERGQEFLHHAEQLAKTLDVGVPGTRDEALFMAAQQLVRRCGLPEDVAEQLLLEHYCPRVSLDGRATVSPARVKYKVQQAASIGQLAFNPLLPIDADKWAVESGKQRMENWVRDNVDAGEAEGEQLVASDLIPMTDKLEKISPEQLMVLLNSHEAWKGKIRTDVFSNRVRYGNTPVVMENKGFVSQNDATRVQMWLAAACNKRTTQAQALQVLDDIAASHRYHAGQEYLRRVQEETTIETGVLEELAVKGLGVSPESLVVIDYVRRFFIGAAKRLLEPGCKHDLMLVLQGPQGSGKSSLLYALSPEERWVQEFLPDLETKDSMEALEGKWLVEISEFQALMKKEEAVVKSFLGRQIDSYRRPYARGKEDVPRQCVFIATTNDDSFLRDSTGARRYLVVESNRIDVAWVRENRDRIWADAARLARTGERNWLTSEEVKAMETHQEPFQDEDEDPWRLPIVKYLEDKEEFESLTSLLRRVFWTSAMTDGEVAKILTQKDLRRASKIVRRLGWTGHVGRRGPNNVWHRR